MENKGELTIDYRQCNLENENIPFENDTFDLVVCSHVLEHIKTPVELYGEMVRVLRPGGHLFIESPSDRACWFSFPFFQNWYMILSFYDDPTHTGRPWTPQALFRLAKYWNVKPITSCYDWSFLAMLTFIPAILFYFVTKNRDKFIQHYWHAIGWSCYSLSQKPLNILGKSNFSYYSFKGL